MASVKKLILFLLSLPIFVYTFFIVGQLMFFLSTPNNIPRHFTWLLNLLDNKSRLDTAYGALFYDTLWVVAFIFQHSFMKSQLVKKVLESLGLESAERAIYCLTSSLCLHYLLSKWISTQSIVLWQVNVVDSKPLWWTFVLIHAFAWVIIYGGGIIMDLPEILGIKQTYYDLKDYAPPVAYKSPELRNLYAHIRHPSFVGLSAVLWVTNLMTLDRLVLAVLLTAYMYFGWTTDYNDVVYQKFQLKRKAHELKSQ